MSEGAPSLILTTIEVDAKSGIASLKTFENQVESTAGKASQSLAKAKEPLAPLSDALQASAKDAKKLGESLAGAGSAAGAAAQGFQLSASAFVAVATAAVYGLDKLMDAADRVTDTRRAFETLTGATKDTAAAFLTSMRPAAQGLVSDTALMLAANKALILEMPVTAETMGDLAGAAVKLGKAMGIDEVQAIDLMTEGIGRQSSRMLKQVGLTIDAADAYETYARTLGLAAKDLDETQRAQAFFNAALEEATRKSATLNESLTSTSDSWKQLKTDIVNAKDALLDFSNSSGGDLDAIVKDEAKRFQSRIPNQVAKDVARLDAFSTARDPKPFSDQGGIDLFNASSASLVTMQQNLATARTHLDDLRTAARVLNTTLQETDEVEMKQLVGVALQSVNDELDKLLGKSKAVKLSLDEIANANFKMGQHLPGALPDEPTRIPALVQPGAVELDTQITEAIAKEQALVFEAQKALADFRVTTMTEGTAAETQARLDALTLAYTAETEKYGKSKDAMLAIDKKYALEKAKILKQGADQSIAVETTGYQLRLNQASMLIGATGTLARAAFGDTKKGAYASAIVNTAQGVTASLKEGGWVGIVLAAITAAAGLIQIQKISSTSFEGGGSGGGGVPSPPSINYSKGVTTGDNVTGTTPVLVSSGPPRPVSPPTPVTSTPVPEQQLPTQTAPVVMGVPTTTPVLPPVTLSPARTILTSRQTEASPAQPTVSSSPNITINVQMLDARSAREWLTSPDISRHIAEAYDQHTSRS